MCLCDTALLHLWAPFPPINLFIDGLDTGYTPVDRSAISAPTLVLYGEHEPSATEAHAAKLAGEIDDARITKLPETGHVANWDSPERFNDALRDILDAVIESEG